MRFGRTTLSEEFAASQVTRRDQIWGVEVIRTNGMFVLMVIDLHTGSPLSAALTSAIADDMATTLANVGVQSGYPEEIWIDDAFDWLSPALESWAARNQISIVRGISDRKSILLSPILKDLVHFLKGKHLSDPEGFNRELEN